MFGKYAYSFDRETFIGQFMSRAEALKAGVAQAGQMPDPPTEIYVGLKTEGDPQATGHAQPILQSMSDRARAASDNAARYVQGVDEQAEAELDQAIEQAILGWLKKHDRMPTFYTVGAISEHTVATATTRV